MEINDDEFMVKALNAAATIPSPSLMVPPSWVFDSGASRHMSGCVDDFVLVSPKSGVISVTEGLKLPIEDCEMVQIYY
jgi:hypothetical protein